MSLPKLLVLTVPAGWTLKTVLLSKWTTTAAETILDVTTTARLVDLDAELMPAPDECNTLIETAFDDGWNAALRRIAEGGGE